VSLTARLLVISNPCPRTALAALGWRSKVETSGHYASRVGPADSPRRSSTAIPLVWTPGLEALECSVLTVVPCFNLSAPAKYHVDVHVNPSRSSSSGEQLRQPPSESPANKKNPGAHSKPTLLHSLWLCSVSKILHVRRCSRSITQRPRLVCR
jgi:hypothetical protein